MKLLKLLIILLAVFSKDAICQQLPVGSCGYVYIYDDAGNRVRRVYFCNNGTDPYPQRNANAFAKSKNASSNIFFTDKELKNAEVVEVNELYPNPTTGKFVIGFSKKLVDAEIVITDGSGKQIQRYKDSGIQLQFDLSGFASGTYFLVIRNKGISMSKKVVKQ